MAVIEERNQAFYTCSLIEFRKLDTHASTQ